MINCPSELYVYNWRIYFLCQWNFVNIIIVNLTVRKETQTLHFFQATISFPVSFEIEVPP